MFKLVNQEGKPISAEGVDPKVASYIESVVGGIGHQVTAAMTATVNNAVKPIAEKLTGFETTIGELKTKAEPKADPKADPKSDPNSDPNAMPAWAKSLSDSVAEIKTNFTGQQEAQRVNALANAWLDKNRPGLKPDQRKAVLAAIVAGKPDSDEKVEQIFKAKQDEYAAIFGKENAEKAFTASVEGEGGEAGRVKQAAEAAEKAKIDALNQYTDSARK